MTDQARNISEYDSIHDVDKGLSVLFQLGLCNSEVHLRSARCEDASLILLRFPLWDPESYAKSTRYCVSTSGSPVSNSCVKDPTASLQNVHDESRV